MLFRRAIETVILPEEEYRKLYEEAFAKPTYTETFTKEMHRAEFDQLDGELRKALEARWEEDPCGNKDFAMMDEGEAFGGWHHCGGIYSTRICCHDYARIIIDVLAPLPHVALWTYHTSCEAWPDDAPLPAFGEFFIRNGKLYAPKDENSYARVFGGRFKFTA